MGENEPTPTVDPDSQAKPGQDGDRAEESAPEPVPAEPPPAEPPLVEPAVEPPLAEELPPVEDPELVALRGAHDATKRDLEQAQTRLRGVSKAYTDLQAEMKAFKERMEARAKLDSELQAYEQVRRFFDPVMNLKRSIASPGEDIAKLLEGLKMVNSQFLEALARLGLEEIAGEGATFDPNKHEAIAVTPVDDPSKDGKVLVVHTTGYAVKGRVLQPAQVVIGKHQDAAGEA